MTTKTTKKPISPLALEEAKDAVTKLKSIKPFLTPADEETLGILIDKELEQSLQKFDRGKTWKIRTRFIEIHFADVRENFYQKLRRIFR